MRSDDRPYDDTPFSFVKALTPDPSRSLAYAQPNLGDESVGAQKAKGLDGRCHIHILSRTNRLADPGGRVHKYLVDSLVSAGVFRDDSTKFISEISESQERVKGPEETVIDIWWEE